MGQHGPQNHPKPSKTLLNHTKPTLSNPLPAFLPQPLSHPFFPNSKTEIIPGVNHTWKITPFANKEPISPNMGQHGPQSHPKPSKTLLNHTKPTLSNPFPAFPPPAPFTSLLPKQQNRNYSWGMWPLNHTWKITPQHGPAWAPKPPKTLLNPTKPHKTNPFQSFPSIPPPAPFTSLLPKQQNRNYSWGMWPLNHTWKITPLANKEPASPNMGRRGPQNHSKPSKTLLNHTKPTLPILSQHSSPSPFHIHSSHSSPSPFHIPSSQTAKPKLFQCDP